MRGGNRDAKQGDRGMTLWLGLTWAWALAAGGGREGGEARGGGGGAGGMVSHTCPDLE